MTPTVTFVVPCYKLGHLLKECVDSILAQTYRDFEVLIMDDHSPDNTPAIAQSFNDARVRHIRNDPNLGSLRNYNKGIKLARGKYVWLISADDYLRRPYILEKYVHLMDSNPSIGYTFCPGVGVLNGCETGLLEYSKYGSGNQVISGHHFLKKLVFSNFVLAASGLVRRTCYEQLGAFPLEGGMVWSGDWYLWSLFAIYHDVGYLDEPMVCYRQHDLSMTSVLKQAGTDDLLVGDTAVPWMVKTKAQTEKLEHLTKLCLQSLAAIYARAFAIRQRGASPSALDSLWKKFEASLNENTNDEREKNWLRARVYIEIADDYYWRGDIASAKQFYDNGLELDPSMTRVKIKRFALSFGNFGNRVRQFVRSLKNGERP